MPEKNLPTNCKRHENYWPGFGSIGNTSEEHFWRKIPLYPQFYGLGLKMSDEILFAKFITIPMKFVYSLLIVTRIGLIAEIEKIFLKRFSVLQSITRIHVTISPIHVTMTNKFQLRSYGKVALFIIGSQN